jgi:hypothetical protein
MPVTLVTNTATNQRVATANQRNVATGKYRLNFGAGLKSTNTV